MVPAMKVDPEYAYVIVIVLLELRLKRVIKLLINPVI